jgi:radical SAM protein with 4Fe4S-binding SPASM domain
MYGPSNPFELPQTIARGIKETAKCTGCGGGDALDYLWVYLSEYSTQVDDHSRPPLTQEEWLGVIDESATKGAGKLIITLCTHRDQFDIATGIAQWAQVAYDMEVGVHFRGEEIARLPLKNLLELNSEKLEIFVEDDSLEALHELRARGVRISPADVAGKEAKPGACGLPERMACVDATGHMYTCGLVLGAEEYCLGHFFEEMLEDTLQNDDKPHTVPKDASEKTHRCNGCPPLLAQRLQRR